MTQMYRTLPDGRTIKNGVRDLKMHRKQFVAWDGEGISGLNPESKAQSYVMLCNSLPGGMLYCDSNAAMVKGLRTVQILDFICDQARTVDGIHVGFALNYDINQWMVGLSKTQMTRLYRTGRTFFSKFNLEWIRGKSLLIRRYPEVVTAQNHKDLKPIDVVTIYDVFPFFQMSFVKTLKEWQPFVQSITPEIIERIHQDKMRRSDFAAADVADMLSYCREEVRLLADLMEEFRRQCIAADIVPNRWDGPGAIATALFTKHKTKRYKSDMSVSPELTSVNEAAQYAFSGGRIELVQYGRHVGRGVWSYDIRSAYPAVIRDLPNLSNGTWVLRRFRSRKPRPVHFGLYKVTISGLHSGRPFSNGVFPTWGRKSDGSIHFRDELTNWYWSPEYELLLRRFGDNIKVHECWEFEPNDPTERPFQFVEQMYEDRARLKREGNPAQLILKLGLNSLYGKTVQQVGRHKPGDVQTIPPYHQLEWAGFITSATRARMTEAAYIAGATINDPGPIISFETDGLISAEPIALPEGPHLGDWEVEEYEAITYIQPGVYFLTGKDGNVKTKTRGFDVMSINEDMVLEGWRTYRDLAIRIDGKPLPPHIMGTTKAFVGFGRASEQFEWRSWITMHRRLRLFPDRKRNPIPGRMDTAHLELQPAAVMNVEHLESCKFDLKFPTALDDGDMWDGVRTKQEFGGGFIGLMEGSM